VNNKVINITILVLLALFILFRVHTALNQMNKSESASEHQFDDFPVVFTGVTPCADCPGIDYTLVLEENRFTELSHYIDRGENLFRNEGTWTINSDTLKLFLTEEDIHKAFLFGDDSLTMLDRDLQKITGELEDNYTMDRAPEEESIRSNHSKLRDDGINFLASGNEPFWNVQIDFDESLTFKTPESETTFPISDFSEQLEEEQVTYQSDEFQISYSPGFCRDSMSGFLFTHIVTVQYDEQTYEGCGKTL